MNELQKHFLEILFFRYVFFTQPYSWGQERRVKQKIRSNVQTILPHSGGCTLDRQYRESLELSTISGQLLTRRIAMTSL